MRPGQPFQTGCQVTRHRLAMPPRVARQCRHARMQQSHPGQPNGLPGASADRSIQHGHVTYQVCKTRCLQVNISVGGHRIQRRANFATCPVHICVFRTTSGRDAAGAANLKRLSAIISLCSGPWGNHSWVVGSTASLWGNTGHESEKMRCQQRPSWQSQLRQAHSPAPAA